MLRDRNSFFFYAGKFNAILCYSMASLISLSVSVKTVKNHENSAQQVKANSLFVMPELKGLVRLKMKCYYWNLILSNALHSEWKLKNTYYSCGVKMNSDTIKQMSFGPNILSILFSTYSIIRISYVMLSHNILTTTHNYFYPIKKHSTKILYYDK